LYSNRTQQNILGEDSKRIHMPCHAMHACMKSIYYTSRLTSAINTVNGFSFSIFIFLNFMSLCILSNKVCFLDGYFAFSTICVISAHQNKFWPWSTSNLLHCLLSHKIILYGRKKESQYPFFFVLFIVCSVAY